MTTRTFANRPNGSPQFIQDHLQKIGTAVATEEQVGPSIKIPAGALGANGSVRVYVKALATNDAVVKNVSVRAGNTPDVITGTVLGKAVLTSLAGGFLEVTLANRNALAVNLSSAIGSGLACVPAAQTIDTAKDLYLVLTTQKASGLAGSVSVESYNVELSVEPTVVTFQ
jgi:hypothetical protein